MTAEPQDSIPGAPAIPVPVDARAVLAAHTLRRATDEPRWDVDRCSECIRPWQGAAETGGCTAVRLARRVIALEGVLEAATTWCELVRDWAGHADIPCYGETCAACYAEVLHDRLRARGGCPTSVCGPSWDPRGARADGEG